MEISGEFYLKTSKIDKKTKTFGQIKKKSEI